MRRVRIDKPTARGLGLVNASTGKEVEAPTVSEFRSAIVGLAEQSGSRVIKLAVHDIFIAFVMAGDDEVPDELALDYANGLLNVAETLVNVANEARAMAIAGRRGGVA